MGKSPRCTVWNLMPPTEEVSNASADVMVDSLVGLGPCPVTEVGSPAAQDRVELVAHFGPGLYVAGRQDFVDPLLHTLDTFLGWTCAQVSFAVPLVTVRAKRIAKEFEAFRSGVFHRG